MATLEKGTVIVIDPNKEEVEKARKMLERSMEKIAIINTKCLFSKRKEITELVSNSNYQKIFYGCSVEFFNKMTAGFNSKKGNIKHIGWELDISQIVIYYWKQKGFVPFLHSTSKIERTFGQEL